MKNPVSGMEEKAESPPQLPTLSREEELLRTEEVREASFESNPQPGVLLEKGDFWIGLPKKKSSMIYLTLAEDTEIKVLNVVEEYYEVMHRGLIGYIEKGIVDIMKPAIEKSPPRLVPEESIAAEQPSASEPESQPEKKRKETSPPGITSCTGKIGEELLPGISCVQYRAKVLEKVSTLEIYLKRIIDKSEINRQKSIDLACRLFVNEQARVFISSLNEGRRSRPVRKYLNGLMALSYDRVEIEWTNIQYVSNLRKGPDGRYFGYVHIEQQFEGFMDGRLVYGDVTEKKISIVLEAYEIIDAQGNSSTRWDIFLSDIGVEQTKTVG